MQNEINLTQIRDEINSIDKELVKLLEKRFNLVLKVGEYKAVRNIPIFDEGREKIVIEKCKKHLDNKKYESYIERLYLQIMNTCKDIERDEIKIL
ncbi:monofunctional chorismate mutase [Sedimentibacter acidaminivorans]|uniref:Monofunctional chorismate mutase n=1 Tax=Sedimentibacter acidaminivorans TaxID=913099 RepID=A0ABS4GFF8_9FIRM|nr:chorismate mutase [Sedimentibacter acidaminivorans]MBP1926419.1 monofunctional chorismate mutase [Sedimentibacter acidaminivorans]